MKTSATLLPLMVALLVVHQTASRASGLPEVNASATAVLWHEPGMSKDQMTPAGPPRRLSNVTVDPVNGPVVRAAYVVPSNRTPQSNAVEKVRFALTYYREWYRDQMERHCFGPKTFNLEMEPDGVTPKVYVVKVANDDAYLRGDLWGRTISEAAAAGIPVWTSRQLWWLVSEAHLQSADGSVTGGTALGAGYGSGDDAGVGMMGGDGLARFTPLYLTNNTPYANRMLPEIGPYRLVQDKSFPWFEGSTFSSVSSSVLGAGLHEMSHAFGLPHDFRNDNNFQGNLMGNGLRGIRGNMFPERYSTDYTRLAYGSALALSVNRYFNPPKAYTDNTAPALNVLTRGNVDPTNGLLHIRFTTSDSTALHGAWLSRNGDLIEEMPLYGRSTNTAFATPHFEPGQADNYTVAVFDTQGNKRWAEVSVTANPGGNRAPRPFLTVSTPTAYIGQNVSLNSSSSSDPDGSSTALRVEWDLDGDETFDTAPSTAKSLTHRFPAAGDFLVRARLTDAQGAQAISSPLPVRVIAPVLAIDRVAEGFCLSWPSAANGFVLQRATDATLSDWAPGDLPLVFTQNRVSTTVTNLSTAEFYRLAR